MYRHSIKIFMAIAVIFAIHACQPSQEQIKTSTNTVMSVNKLIDSTYLELKNAFESYDNARIDASIESLKTMLNTAQQDLENMDIPENCNDLRKAVDEKIIVMKQLADKELNEQVRIYKIDDADFTDSLREEWDRYAASTEQKIKDANNKVKTQLDKLSNPTKN